MNVAVLDFKTKWSEFQMASQTDTEQDEAKLRTGSSIYIGPLDQFLKFLSPFQKNFKTNGTSIESTNKGLLDS